MEHEAVHGIDLVPIVALLGAGVVAVPLFRRLGLGSVLGYLAAGLAVGPYGIGIVHDPGAVLHAAELGVVLFLFIVGLEMEPSKLWKLRRQIFGLGVLQVALCSALLTAVGVLFGLRPAVAFVAGAGFVLTSTAIVMQVLEERGELGSDAGQKIVSILLLEDLAIVPLLAAVALLAPNHERTTSRWLGVGLALAAVGTVVAVGRWILNPVFRLLAESKAREVMTAAALLVVLGAALVMQLGGLSMAMGAFLAGVLLSTSSFRHQLEADVEPFRGILLGLFFLAVGMSLDLSIVAQDWRIIAIAVLACMTIKGLAIYVLARILSTGRKEARDRAVLMAQGGEFAFVLYTTASTVGILDARTNAMLSATVILSMALTPLTLAALRLFPSSDAPSMDGVEVADGLRGQTLVIGFGRFGQIASQPLLARKHRVSIIDNDPEMIRAAATFGFKVHYGDGTRLDILRAAGASHADLVLVCVDQWEATTKIVELLRDEFPLVKVMARAFDRGHAIELIRRGVDYQIRETFESALTFGAESIRLLGATDDEALEIVAAVRDRDRQRFELQLVGDLQAGRELLLSNATEQAREQGLSGERPETLDLPATGPTPSS